MSQGEIEPRQTLGSKDQELVAKDYVMTGQIEKPLDSHSKNNTIFLMAFGLSGLTGAGAVVGLLSGMGLFGLLSIILMVAATVLGSTGIIGLLGWKTLLIYGAQYSLENETGSKQNRIPKHEAMRAIRSGEGIIAEHVSMIPGEPVSVNSVYYHKGKSTHMTRNYLPASEAWIDSFKKTLEIK